MDRLADTSLAFIDIETSGLDPHKHEILSFAAIVRSPLGDRAAHFKIRPEHIETAEAQALSVNGYTPEKWADAISTDVAAPAIEHALERSILVGHNVAFDIAFIREFLKKYRPESLQRLGRMRSLDTMTLAYEHLAPCGLDSLSLMDICNFLGISNEGEHDALTDVRRCMSVYDTLLRSSPIRRFLWRRTGPGREAQGRARKS